MYTVVTHHIILPYPELPSDHQHNGNCMASLANSTKVGQQGYHSFSYSASFCSRLPDVLNIRG